MTLLYTKAQKALIKLVHDVAEQELKPYVAEADRAGECPAELYEFGFDLGLHLVEVPKEYGGTGLDYETTAMILSLIHIYARRSGMFAARFRYEWQGILHGASTRSPS